MQVDESGNQLLGIFPAAQVMGEVTKLVGLISIYNYNRY